MAQCKNYPNGCNGQVRIDHKNNKWYCEKHFFGYGRMKGLGLKESKTNNLIRRGKLPPRGGPPNPPRGGPPR